MRNLKALRLLAAPALLVILAGMPGTASAQRTIEELEERHPWRGGAFRHLRELKRKERAAAKREGVPESVDPEAAASARRCLFGPSDKVRYTRSEIVFSTSGARLAGHRGIEIAAGGTALVQVSHAGEGAIDRVVHFVLGPGYDPQRNTGYAHLSGENAWGVERLERVFQWNVPSGTSPGIHALHACTILRGGGALRSRLIIRVAEKKPPPKRGPFYSTGRGRDQ